MGRRVVMAAAAAVGGALWVGKAGAILAGRQQPDHLFETAPVAFALVALVLSLEIRPAAARRVPLALAVVALLSSVLAAGWDLVTGEVLGPALMLGVLTMLVGLGLAGRRARGGRYGDRVPRWAVGIAVATVPLVVAGGVLAMRTTERALEVPILLLGLAWLALAGIVLQDRRATAGSARW